MELRRLALLGGFCFYFPCSLLGQFPSTLSQKLLYTSTQSAQKALSQYVDALEDHPHDYALLKKDRRKPTKTGVPLYKSPGKEKCDSWSRPCKFRRSLGYSYPRNEYRGP